MSYIPYTPRFNNGKEFMYFKTIQDAKQYEKTDFYIGKMPEGSYMIYKKNIYQIIQYNNNKEKMICINSAENNNKIELDVREKAYYMGEYKNRYN